MPAVSSDERRANIGADVWLNKWQCDAQIHRYIGHRFQRVTIVCLFVCLFFFFNFFFWCFLFFFFCFFSLNFLKYNFNFKRMKQTKQIPFFSVNNFSPFFEPSVTKEKKITKYHRRWRAKEGGGRDISRFCFVVVYNWKWQVNRWTDYIILA